MQGTPEAHRAIAEHQHRQAVAPELRRLSWKINLAQAVPFALYALATTALVVAIIMLKRGNG